MGTAVPIFFAAALAVEAFSQQQFFCAPISWKTFQWGVRAEWPGPDVIFPATTDRMSKGPGALDCGTLHP